MRVFVSFGYNERDRWVKELVFPVVKAFSHTIETGEDMAGQPIQAGVAARIERSQAMLGFVTRRGDPVNDVWATHRWVTDELAYALAKGLLIIEAREAGVDPQGGLPGNLQHLVYEEGRRDEFVRDLVKALGQWPRGRVQLQLVGEDLEQLVPLLRRPEFRCTYRFHKEDGDETDEMPTRIVPITGGLFINIDRVPPRALIQVEITYLNKVWSSQFESLDSHNIRVFEG